MTDKRTITVSVNGTKHTKEVPVRITLADFIRYELGLTGTHLGCEHGVCGACTILLDGRSARSCLMLAVQADGCDVTTVEGVAAQDGTFHPVQTALREEHALQCGFCTPGIVCTLAALTRGDQNPSEEQLLAAMSGHICRCTGYQGIRRAITRLAAGAAA